MLTEPLILLLIGVLAGFLAGFLGIGGGIVMVPSLAFLLQYNMHVAIGTALLAMVFLTLIGALTHFKKEEFDSKAWIGLVGGGVPGAYIGSKLAALSPSAYLSIIFGMIVIVMGTWMALDIQATTSKVRNKSFIDYLILSIFAFGIGMMSALSGLGGGIFMVPLMIFLGLRHEIAVGTSLGVIVLTSFSASVGYIRQGSVDFVSSLVLAISAFIFTYIGARTTANVSRSKFKRIFGIVAILVGIRTLIAGL